MKSTEEILREIDRLIIAHAETLICLRNDRHVDQEVDMIKGSIDCLRSLRSWIVGEYE